MRKLLLRWLINAIAVYIAAWVVPGIHAAEGPLTWIIVAAILGLVNALVRPFLTLLTCPLVILTLGLFTLVINALMLQLAAWLAGDWFYIAGFWPALFGALIISIVSALLSTFLGDKDEDEVDVEYVEVRYRK